MPVVMMRSPTCVSRPLPVGARSLRSHVLRAYAPATSLSDLKAAPRQRLVADVNGQAVLVVLWEDESVYAVSNKCPHLNLSLVGTTELMQAEVKDKCVICPAHKTAFDLETGEVKGEWCPGMPDIPFVGKINNDAKPLAVFASRVTDDGVVEVDV